MIHGANIYKYAKELGVDPEEILDFSSNINSYQPGINVACDMTLYADSSYADLRAIIAKRYGIKRKNISLFNGATAAIDALLHHLQEQKVYLYAPLYGEYERACEGKEVIKINRFEKEWQIPSKKSIVVFVNPSTPDGKYYKLKKLLKVWKKQECSIIIDESFLAFEDLGSLRKEIFNYKKLYIVQSFTKFYSCAGVRIGAIFSQYALPTPLWNLSSYDVAFLQKRMRDKSFLKKAQILHRKNKVALYKILKSSQLFEKIYPTKSNYFLVKSVYAQQIFEALLEHKILVRTCSSFDFLDETYLRFGVKDAKMHKKLSKALDALSLNLRYK